MYRLTLSRDYFSEAIEVELDDDCITGENLYKSLESICDIINIDLEEYLIERRNRDIIQ